MKRRETEFPNELQCYTTCWLSGNKITSEENRMQIKNNIFVK